MPANNFKIIKIIITLCGGNYKLTWQQQKTFEKCISTWLEPTVFNQFIQREAPNKRSFFLLTRSHLSEEAQLTIHSTQRVPDCCWGEHNKNITSLFAARWKRSHFNGHCAFFPGEWIFSHTKVYPHTITLRAQWRRNCGFVKYNSVTELRSTRHLAPNCNFIKGQKSQTSSRFYQLTADDGERCVCDTSSLIWTDRRAAGARDAKPRRPTSTRRNETLRPGCAQPF
jgi:hypothetical protein